MQLHTFSSFFTRVYRNCATLSIRGVIPAAAAAAPLTHHTMQARKISVARGNSTTRYGSRSVAQHSHGFYLCLVAQMPCFEQPWRECGARLA